MIRAFLSLLILFFLSTPSYAADINDEGAARLKGQFATLLANQKKAVENAGGTLELDGDITVEQASNYYALTLPSLALTDSDGNVHKIGLIAINATPTNAPNNWKMSVALPTPILSFDKDEKPLTRLDIGNQRMGGIWNGDLNSFSKVVARYNDLKLSDYTKQTITTLKQVDITSDFKQSSDKKWSGPSQLTLSGLNASTVKYPNIVKINTINLKSTIEGFSPQKEILDDIEKKLSDDKQNLQSIFQSYLKNIGDPATFQGVINGLEYNPPKTRNNASIGFSITSISFELNANGFKDGIINQNFKLGYRGLKAPNSTHRYKELFPETLNIDLSLNKLPILDLIGIVEKAFPEGEDNASSKQVASLQLMMNLPQILSKAGTNLTLSNTSFGNSLYNADFNGTIKADSNSIIGATGYLNSEITGLDNTIKMLEAKIKNETNPTTKTQMTNGLKRLMALKGISKNEDDKSICNVVLNEQAKITVNGQDATGLLELITQ